MNKENFGTTLRKVRLEKGLAMPELSKISGISISAITNLEANNIKKPYISTLKLLCTSLELDLDQALKFFGYLEDDIEAKTFGAMLKKARLAKGLTMSELSDISGLAKSTISNLEADKIKKTHRATLSKLCASLDLNSD